MRRVLLSSGALMGATRATPQFRMTSSSAPPPSAGMLVLDAEPEFEGQAHPHTPGKATIPSNKTTTAAATTAAPVSRLPHGFIPPKRAVDPKVGLIRKLRSEDFDEIRRVYDAYCNYFNNIKFRNGWETPRFDREKCKENWTTAAEYVVRIRRILDERNPGQKLRMKDGAAQEFFFAPSTKQLGDGTSFDFMIALVHATLRDAMGYVEGLTRAQVSDFVRVISEYRFNPKIHALHVLGEVDAMLQHTVMRDNLPAAVMEAELNAEGAWTKRLDDFYVGAENEAADKEWRGAIKSLYEALEHFESAERLMRNALVDHTPPKAKK